jgi:hypothetical protein
MVWWSGVGMGVVVAWCRERVCVLLIWQPIESVGDVTLWWSGRGSGNGSSGTVVS